MAIQFSLCVKLLACVYTIILEVIFVLRVCACACVWACACRRRWE